MDFSCYLLFAFHGMNRSLLRGFVPLDPVYIFFFLFFLAFFVWHKGYARWMSLFLSILDLIFILWFGYIMVWAAGRSSRLIYRFFNSRSNFSSF